MKHIHYIFRSFVIRNARFSTVCETEELSLSHRRIKNIQRPLSTEVPIHTICLVTSTCTEMYPRRLENQSLFSCCSNIACRRIFSIRCYVRPSSSHTKTPKIVRNRARGSCQISYAAPLGAQNPSCCATMKQSRTLHLLSNHTSVHTTSSQASAWFQIQFCYDPLDVTSKTRSLHIPSDQEGLLAKNQTIMHRILLETMTPQKASIWSTRAAQKKTPRLVCPRTMPQSTCLQFTSLSETQTCTVKAEISSLSYLSANRTWIHPRTYYRHHRLSPPQQNVSTLTSANFGHFHHRLKTVRPEINAPSVFI